MAGTARKMVDKLLSEKAAGDKTIENNIRVKLILKGIQVDKITGATPDDPVMLGKIKTVLDQFGVKY